MVKQPRSTKAKPKKKAKTEEKQILDLHRRVRAIERGIETKQFDHEHHGNMDTLTVSGSTYWYYRHAFGNQQGVADNERIGDEILLKKLILEMRVSAPTAELDPVTFRILILNDKQHANSSTMAVTNPFGQKTSPLENLSGAITDPTVMQRKWDMLNRYKFYRDVTETVEQRNVRQFQVASGNTIQTLNKDFIRRFEIKLNIKQRYTGNSALVADIVTNLPQFLIIAKTSASNPTTPWAIAVNSRFEYQDC